jgi:CheY-like chemotaxis protein
MTMSELEDAVTVGTASFYPNTILPRVTFFSSCSSSTASVSVWRTTGLEAIEMAEIYNPDIVLIDISLPSLDGYQVARRYAPVSLARGRY